MTEKKRGFATMDPEKHRTLARKAGASVAPENRTFSLNRALASESGRKGGLAVDPANRAFSKDRELAATAGRKGAAERAKKKETKP